MAKIPYDGSLVDDINLVNQSEKKSITDGGKTFIFILLCDIFLSALGTTIGLSIPISAGILAFCNSWLLTAARNWEKKITKFNESRREATNHIRDLIKTLSKTDEESINLVATVDYEDIKDAVVISDVTQEEIDDDMKIFVKEELKSDFVDVVTSKIYYLNSENKINVLKEVKKTFENYDHNALIKVIGTRKPIHVKITTLELEEVKEEERNLPVKVVLKLK